jgi:Carboxypeptidase regulatory-like domain
LFYCLVISTLGSQMILRRLGLLMIVLELAHTFAFAQTVGQSGTLNLQVTDPSGAGLEANLVLTGPPHFSMVTAKTSAQGAWTASGLPTGRYRLDLSRDGFEPRTVPFEVRSSSSVSIRTSLRVENLSTTVTVISPTPLNSDSLPLNQSPIPVRVLTATEMTNSSALDLTDAMNKRLNGIYVNENAGNPFEPDVNYRGYTASPLLGTPQGLSGLP